MPSWWFSASAVAVLSKLAVVRAEAGEEAGQCAFDNEPIGVGSFWDPSCHMGGLGCNADGKNVECRLCGAGDEVGVPCPPSSCKFPNQPFVSYYWDEDCKAGELGCWADGVHEQCRFCGDHPYIGIPCPEGAAPPNSASCAFQNEPAIPYYWEPGCEEGHFGCQADGANVQCRFCGEGIYEDIPCPASEVCHFANEPAAPYFWDPECKAGGLGCNADGIHMECRFCAARPFESVQCPGSEAKPEGACTWPLHSEPAVPYFWDSSCEMDVLGCWADGIHAECRFCGSGSYSSIACPETAATPKDVSSEDSTLARWVGQQGESFKDVRVQTASATSHKGRALAAERPTVHV